MGTSAATTIDTAGWHKLADNLKPETRCFIDGDFVAAEKGGTFETLNPATGDAIAEVARGTAEDIDAAVAAARRAFKSGVWSRMAPRKRMNVLYRYAQRIAEHGREFALLDTLDMGKPISEMINSDVPSAAQTLQFFAETIDKLDGMVTNTASSALHYILRQPLGVVGCIVPWNYPLMMAAWKIAPALAAGNTVVLKPAEQSPLSALLLAQLFIEAGGPPGVLNVVPGLGEEAGRALALHNDVDKIGFTGSVEVGKLMMVYAGQSNMKRVTTECGGKTPQIVLGDVPDLDTAVQYAVDGIYGNQGEVCNAGSRLLVEQKILDEFTERFREKSKAAFAPGDPLDPATTMGPLVTAEHQQRVLGYVEIGKQGWRHPRLRRRCAVGLRARLLRGADAVHRREQRHAHRPGGNLRTRREHPAGARRRRCDCDRERLDLRPRGLDLDIRREHRPPLRARHRSGCGLDQLLRPRGHDVDLGWLQAVGHGARQVLRGAAPPHADQVGVVAPRRRLIAETLSSGFANGGAPPHESAIRWPDRLGGPPKAP